MPDQTEERRGVLATEYSRSRVIRSQLGASASSGRAGCNGNATGHVTGSRACRLSQLGFENLLFEAWETGGHGRGGSRAPYVYRVRCYMYRVMGGKGRELAHKKVYVSAKCQEISPLSNGEDRWLRPSFKVDVYY